MNCNHTIQPWGYREWHTWAESMSKTHEQSQCKECKLWTIWKKK